MTSLGMGARLAGARLIHRRSALGFLVALMAVAAGAALERVSGSRLAADRALTGVALGLVLPLSCWGTLSRALDGSRLDRALAEIARHGGSRRQAALGVLTVVALAQASLGALLALLAVVVTRAPADPLLLRDLATSTWIGALGGVTYAAWFLLGSTVGRKGGGRSWGLVLDWVLGAGASAMALPWPRGHLRNLLGAEPILAMPQWSATLALCLLGAIYAGLALWRSPR